jgi:dTDP-4-amino-4,6-dideoxygalactose transaminase
MATAVTRAASNVPAVLGGRPMFPHGLPMVRPTVPDGDQVSEDVRKIFASGILTNGPYVAEFERRSAEILGVRRCVAVSSCTAGLMLILRASDLTGDIIVPSFTFAATAHAVVWNGLRPVFADVDPETLTMSPESAIRSIGVRTSGILATHIYGTPCDVDGLSEIAKRSGVRLFYDAAHAYGSHHLGRPVGSFGDAEVFSLSPTKVVVAGEGGIIATNDEILAERCRIGRDYGNPGDYNCRFVGLNARMSEVHAAVALHSLEDLSERIEKRNALARSYHEALGPIPGISFPVVREGDRSTFKDLALLVDPDEFGLSVTDLVDALAAEGIETRRYYSPPVHQMTAYRAYSGVNGNLPATLHAASRVLAVPFWADMTERQIARVARAFERIRRYSTESTEAVHANASGMTWR